MTSPAASARVVTSAETDQHLKNLRVYGYTRVEAYLPPEAVSRLLALVEKHHAGARALDYSGRPSRDARDKMVYNLQNKDKLFIDLLAEPFLQSVLPAMLNDQFYRFLPPETPNYILSYYNARSSGEKLDLHIDTYIPFPGERTYAMQAAFVLEEHSLDNGCTVVVPGSHTLGAYTDRSLQKVEPILANPGDLVLWDSRLWHGTNENVSGRSRWTMIATFTSWWIKQSMDIPRGLPDAIYRALSDPQKALLGFCSIPPKDEAERINTKTGYDSLKPSVEDYR